MEVEEQKEKSAECGVCCKKPVFSIGDGVHTKGWTIKPPAVQLLGSEKTASAASWL